MTSWCCHIEDEVGVANGLSQHSEHRAVREET